MRGAISEIPQAKKGAACCAPTRTKINGRGYSREPEAAEPPSLPDELGL
jgi:hypothetical protein